MVSKKNFPLNIILYTKFNNCSGLQHHLAYAGHICPKDAGSLTKICIRTLAFRYVATMSICSIVNLCDAARAKNIFRSILLQLGNQMLLDTISCCRSPCITTRAFRLSNDPSDFNLILNSFMKGVTDPPDSGYSI